MTGTQQDAGDPHTIALADKVTALTRPGIYPEATESVETVETHMSWVFLTDTHAYKLKKPVQSRFLDFSTVERRRIDGEKELRLNRRLAPDVYLALVPLTLHAGHRLALGGDGAIVDWLVKMKRLPRHKMLDHMIEQGTTAADRLSALGGLLAEFYAARQPVTMTPQAYRQRLAEDIEATREVLSAPAYDLPADRVHALVDAMLAYIERAGVELDARVNAQRLIEGHGDLRPEHVCLTDPPVIIDCLEFNRDLRLLDAADEVAFLALECERLGAPEVGEAITAAYTTRRADDAPATLLHFYKAYRACVRAKVAVWHIDDHAIDHHAKWIGRAEHYLTLAEHHITASQAEG